MLGLGFRIMKRRKKKGFPIFKKFLILFYNERKDTDDITIINKIEEES